MTVWTRQGCGQGEAWERAAPPSSCAPFPGLPSLREPSGQSTRGTGGRWTPRECVVGWRLAPLLASPFLCQWPLDA